MARGCRAWKKGKSSTALLLYSFSSLLANFRAGRHTFEGGKVLLLPMEAVSTSLNFSAVSKPLKWLWVLWYFVVSSKAAALGVRSLKINKSQVSWQTWTEGHQAPSLISKLVSLICAFEDINLSPFRASTSVLCFSKKLLPFAYPNVPERCQPIPADTGITPLQPPSLGLTPQPSQPL